MGRVAHVRIGGGVDLPALGYGACGLKHSSSYTVTPYITPLSLSLGWSKSSRLVYVIHQYRFNLKRFMRHNTCIYGRCPERFGATNARNTPLQDLIQYLRNIQINQN